MNIFLPPLISKISGTKYSERVERGVTTEWGMWLDKGQSLFVPPPFLQASGSIMARSCLKNVNTYVELSVSLVLSSLSFMVKDMPK